MGGDDESTFRTHHHDDTVDEAVESLGRQMKQPRRHFLTTGWSTFVSSKRLVAGDAFVFLRVGMGVLATASHAVVIKTIFLVFYKPRISQFIVGVNKYMEAMKH
ncbi:hypothetical protein Bca101_006912 [Brassica carinata]